MDHPKGDWRPVPAFPDYSINRSGDVWSHRAGRRLKPDYKRRVAFCQKYAIHRRSVPALLWTVFGAEAYYTFTVSH
jgi:hypothetical protein